MKNLTWQNPEQLFVAQELINKVKSKCCGIKVNNAGKELFEVYKIDNGPDYVSDGLFRIVGKNSKIGFADTCGAIVIPPVFSYATPFHNGEAKVSFGGKNEKQGEYQSWKSNLWFLIKKSK